MNNVYVILGKSASGKDTVMKELIKNYALHPIVYYTTRPKRNGEEDGVEYHFLKDFSKEELEKNKIINKIIEKRGYDTINGKWEYLTAVNSDFENDLDGIIALPPAAYLKWIESPLLSKYKIIPIYIHVDDKERLLRSIERDSRQNNPNYEETCRRFLADAEDFKGLNFENIFNNSNSLFCASQIAKKFIFKERTLK